MAMAKKILIATRNAGKIAEMQNELRTALAQHHGVTTLRIKKLRGFYDNNFQITSARGDFFARIYNRDTPKAIQFQIALVRCLKDAGVPVAPYLPSRTGAFITRCGKRYLTVQKFISGELLNDVRWNRVLLRNVGKMLATMHRATEKRRSLHGALKKYEWDLAQFDLLLRQTARKRRRLPSRARDLVQGTVAQWRAQKTALTHLPTGVVHGDYHAANILVARNQCVAVLDFGDALTSWYAADIAVSIYHLFAKQGSLRFLREFLKGYAAARTISAQEARMIPLLVKLRAAGILLELHYIRKEALAVLEYLDDQKNLARVTRMIQNALVGTYRKS